MPKTSTHQLTKPSEIVRCYPILCSCQRTDKPVKPVCRVGELSCAQITKPEDPAPNDEGSWILICDARYADTQNVSSAFKVQMHIEN